MRTNEEWKWLIRMALRRELQRAEKIEGQHDVFDLKLGLQNLVTLCENTIHDWQPEPFGAAGKKA